MAKPPFVLRMRRELDGPVPPPAIPTGVTIRTLDRDDARAAHAVLEAGYWEGGGGAPNFTRWWRLLRKDSEFDPGLFFLALDGEGVAGIAQCWTSHFVKDIAVHPRARRQGIGRALMLTTFQAFADRGAPHVDLKVREENETAQRLYRDLDMRVVERLAG